MSRPVGPCRRSAEAVAEFAFEDLAAGVAREGVGEDDPFGCLEGGEPFAGVGEEFGLGGVGAGDDDGGDGLDPLVVGEADDGGLGDGGVGVEGVLDLAGGDEDSAGVDDVLEPVDDGEVALLVADGEVAGVEPAAAERLGALLGQAPVAVAELRGAVDDLAGGAVGDLLALLVDDAGLDEEDGLGRRSRGGPRARRGRGPGRAGRSRSARSS